MSIAVSDKPSSYSASVTGGPTPGQLFLWSITSALAGFLFGFDTVVISGAEQTIQTLWRENAQLKQERDVLKKSVAFFARDRS